MMQFLAEWLYQHIIGSDSMIGKLPPLEEWMMKENICEFSDEYCLGHDLIDNEHRQLFKLIDKANRLVRDGVDEAHIDELMAIFAELKTYTEYHFSDEEEYMESIHYEGLEAQKRAHSAFISKIADIRKEDVENNPQEYMQSMVEYLLGWLINHILYTDKKIPV
jgi:hemerythrin